MKKCGEKCRIIIDFTLAVHYLSPMIFSLSIRHLWLGHCPWMAIFGASGTAYTYLGYLVYSRPNYFMNTEATYKVKMFLLIPSSRGIIVLVPMKFRDTSDHYFPYECLTREFLQASAGVNWVNHSITQQAGK